MPDQPVEDRRRPLGAPANRARRPLQQPRLARAVPSRPVFVVTGPSGAGKGTLIKGLLERVAGLEIAVSATTRPQRPGEEDGHDYWFLSDVEFTRRVDADEFLEWVPYVSGRRYGTLRSEIDRISSEESVCVLELELEGALRVQDEV
ncbi:MAG TPA: hypothetical protein VIV37_07550, partial [Gaiellaceae bacterium]